MVMFSANLNRNRRIENFTVWADKDMCAEYIQMVEELWRRQPANAARMNPARARRDTAAVLGTRKQPTEDPPSTSPFTIHPSDIEKWKF